MDIYKRLLVYLKPYKMRIVWALIFTGLTSGMISVQTYLVKYVLDDVFVNKNKTLLYLIPPALIVVTLIKGITSYAKDYFIGYVGQKIINNIRDELYAHVQSLSFSYFTRTPTGVIVSRIMNDVNLVQGALTRVPATLVQGIATMTGLLIVIFYLNWRLALLAFVALPLAGLALSKFSRRLRKTSTTMQEQMGQLTTHLHETIGGVRIVKAFGMEEYESKRFAERNRDLFNSLMRGIKTTAISHPVTELISIIGTSLVVGFGGYSVIRGAMTVGDFGSFSMALVFFYRPLKDMNGANNIIQDGMAAARRIFEVLDTKPEICDVPGSRPLPRNFVSIELKNVFFQYEDTPVLKDINLNVRTGETLAIVGQSGGGKTTLVNLIPRFYDVTSGAILIGEADIRNCTLASLRSQIAMVTQQTILFNDSVLANIAYGNASCSFDAVVQAAQAAHADTFIRALPQGYNTVIGESGVKLSGGQRQRIAIARAILKDAPLLILDEATSSLDTESEREVQKALETLMKGRTSFVIAHRLSTVINADRIVVLKDGRIVEEGRHEELLRKNGEYKNLYDQQFRDEPSQRVEE